MKGALRYVALKTIIERNLLANLYEAREYVPITTLARDFGAHHYNFKKKLMHPGHFTINEVIRLAAQFDIDTKFLLDMILRDVYEQKRKTLDLPPNKELPSAHPRKSFS